MNSLVTLCSYEANRDYPNYWYSIVVCCYFILILMVGFTCSCRGYTVLTLTQSTCVWW